MQFCKHLKKNLSAEGGDSNRNNEISACNCFTTKFSSSSVYWGSTNQIRLVCSTKFAIFRRPAASRHSFSLSSITLSHVWLFRRTKVWQHCRGLSTDAITALACFWKTAIPWRGVQSLQHPVLSRKVMTCWAQLWRSVGSSCGSRSQAWRGVQGVYSV